MPENPARYLQVVPSNQFIVASYADKTITDTSVVKMKEISIAIPGSYRTRYNALYGAAATSSAYTRIYVNGVPVGATHAAPNANGESNTEDILGLKAGDLVQVWGVAAGGNSLTVSGFVLSGSYQMLPEPVVAGAVNLD